MSKFFVGQRVRLVWPRDPKNFGATGRISYLGRIECGSYFKGELCDEGDCAVDWDDSDWSPEYLRKLEPILAQHKPCDADFKESLDTLLEALTRPCKGEVTP